MIMILQADPYSRIFLTAFTSSPFSFSLPSLNQKTHFLNIPRGRSWRERITQFRHVTIPRLEKPTNFKTNGTVISTPDMTNSRPFLFPVSSRSFVLSRPFTFLPARSPAAFSRHHRALKKGSLQNKAPFLLLLLRHFIFHILCDYVAHAPS